MARILTDEQFPVRISDRLRKLGHDVVTVRAFDISTRGDGKSDEDVLDIARIEHRIVLTLNVKDFQRLHDVERRPAHHGIVGYVLSDDTPAVQAQLIDQRIRREDTPPAHLSNQMIIIVRERRTCGAYRVMRAAADAYCHRG